MQKYPQNHMESNSAVFAVSTRQLLSSRTLTLGKPFAEGGEERKNCVAVGERILLWKNRLQTTHVLLFF